MNRHQARWSRDDPGTVCYSGNPGILGQGGHIGPEMIPGLSANPGILGYLDGGGQLRHVGPGIPGLSAIPGILGYLDRGAPTPRWSQDDPGTVCYSGNPGILRQGGSYATSVPGRSRDCLLFRVSWKVNGSPLWFLGFYGHVLASLDMDEDPSRNFSDLIIMYILNDKGKLFLVGYISHLI